MVSLILLGIAAIVGCVCFSVASAEYQENSYLMSQFMAAAWCCGCVAVAAFVLAAGLSVKSVDTAVEPVVMEIVE